MNQRERDIIEAANRYREIVLANGAEDGSAFAFEKELKCAAMIPDDGPSLRERRESLMGPHERALLAAHELLEARAPK